MRKILILTSVLRSQLESGLWNSLKNMYDDYFKDHRYDNIRFYGYCSMNDEERYLSPHDTLGYIDVDNKLVLLPQGDDLFSSYDRSRATMRTLVQHLREADYVLFTNCTTYINIPLLNDFVQALDEEDLKIYCGRVISSKYMSGPYQWCFYGEGSGILLRRPWITFILDNAWRKHIIENDHVNASKKWEFYKRNVTDTAIGCLVNDFLISDDTANCLSFLEIHEAVIRWESVDHTLYWQDWGQDKWDQEEPQVWPIMLSIDCRSNDDEDTAKILNEVHKEIINYYKENDYHTNMRYIEAYVENPQTPIITQSLDKPECCIDDYEKVPFDDYHKWLEENSDIPNLKVDENGHLVEVPEEQKHRRSYINQWGQEIPEGMTYAEYFNIPFWDHKCWYRHPWAGENFCGCCQREQLVYPEGSPIHVHDGTEECGCKKSECGCDCDKSSKDSSSGEGSKGKDSSYGCFYWELI